ncbi:hypothetical protein [Amorphus sp. 3PC139-8]|uniref:hypothetical protein n=1 Tax=Amorphus sp. 3PC139-8 TaxID=2735676 RepID=UPI00345D44D1
MDNTETARQDHAARHTGEDALQLIRGWVLGHAAQLLQWEAEAKRYEDMAIEIIARGMTGDSAPCIPTFDGRGGTFDPVSDQETGYYAPQTTQAPKGLSEGEHARFAKQWHVSRFLHTAAHLRRDAEAPGWAIREKAPE